MSRVAERIEEVESCLRTTPPSVFTEEELKRFVLAHEQALGNLRKIPKGESPWFGATDCYCGYTDIRAQSCESCQCPQASPSCPCGELALAPK